MINPMAAIWLVALSRAEQPSTITNAALQTSNWHTVGANTSPNDQIDARIDHNFSEKFRMFARGSNQTGFSSDFNGFGDPGHQPGNRPTHYYNRNITVNAIYTLSPTTILELQLRLRPRLVGAHPFLAGHLPGSVGFPSSLNAIVQNFEFPQVSSAATAGLQPGSGFLSQLCTISPIRISSAAT